jgi:hypothetical protein
MTEETAPISEETQLENITKMCDGYSEVSDEGYKDTFFYVEKDGKTLYPFIYFVTNRIEEIIEKCIILIKKNEYIKLQEDKKVTYSH